MNRIFCIVGKSGSGKDTIYNKILTKSRPNLIPIIPYTTRPKRNDEEDAVNYFFVTDKQLIQYQEDNQVIEERQYFTTHGIWHYFTLKFEIVEGKDYILITTLDGVHSIIDQYGSEMVHVIYLYISDKERLIRCINRESQQKDPNYSEVCRRYIADQEDFSEEELNKFENIHYINTNLNLTDCIKRWDELYERREF